MGRAIIVANQKGGVGKTTTVVNMSAYMAEAGRKTLVIDLDSQGNSCSGLGVSRGDDTKGLYEALLGMVDVKDIIIPTDVKNLYVIPSNINLSGAQVEMVEMENREYKLKAVVDKVKNDFDYVFIDSVLVGLLPPFIGGIRAGKAEPR